MNQKHRFSYNKQTNKEIKHIYLIKSKDMAFIFSIFKLQTIQMVNEIVNW